MAHSGAQRENGHVLASESCSEAGDGDALLATDDFYFSASKGCTTAAESELLEQYAAGAEAQVVDDASDAASSLECEGGDPDESLQADLIRMLVDNERREVAKALANAASVTPGITADLEAPGVAAALTTPAAREVTVEIQLDQGADGKGKDGQVGKPRPAISEPIGAGDPDDITEGSEDVLPGEVVEGSDTEATEDTVDTADTEASEGTPAPAKAPPQTSAQAAAQVPSQSAAQREKATSNAQLPARTEVASRDASPSPVSDEDPGAVTLGPAPGVAEVVSHEEAAAAAVPELEPRAQALRDLLVGGVCTEVGLPYRALVGRLHRRVTAAAVPAQPATAGGSPAAPSGARTMVSFALKPTPLTKPAVKAPSVKAAAKPRDLARIPSREVVHKLTGGQVVVLDEDADEAPVSAPRPSVAEPAASEDAAPRRSPSGGLEVTNGTAPEQRSAPKATVIVSTPEEIEDPYTSRLAPLALLRAYTTQGRWFGARKGCVVFEDDGVTYPMTTLVPIQEGPEDPDLLSLGSVWLLAAMRKRYDTGATPSLLQKHSATRIPARHVHSLLAFLVGETDRCGLLVAADGLDVVPAPTPLRVPRPSVEGVAKPPLSHAELLWYPGVEPPDVEGMKERLESLRLKLAEEAEDAAAWRELGESIRAAAQVGAALRRLDAEEKALESLVADLQASLRATEAELEDATGRTRSLHQEYLEELSSTKKRRLNGHTPGGPEKSVMQSDPLGRLLVPPERRPPPSTPIMG